MKCGAPLAACTNSTGKSRYSKLPETTKRYEVEGVEADPRTPEEMRKMLPAEMAKWANVAKVANIRGQ